MFANKFNSCFHFMKNSSSNTMFVLSVLCLCIAGYFLAYHLFFLELPIIKISNIDNNVEKENFKYSGVSHFEGIKIKNGNIVSVKFRMPRVARLAKNRKIEIFIKSNKISSGDTLGVLSCDQDGKIKKIEVKNVDLQRVTIPLVLSKSVNAINNINFEFISDKNDQNSEIIIAVNIVDINLLTFFLLFMILSVIFFCARLKCANNTDVFSVQVLMNLLVILALYYFHSGAFISNDYFPGEHGKIYGGIRQVESVVKTGSFSETMYRSSGFCLVPVVTMAIEGSLSPKGLYDTYPTSRYVMFVFVAISLLWLLIVLNDVFGLYISSVFGFLYAIFHPFIMDMYYSDSDAYFIPLMNLIVACFIKISLSKLNYKLYFILLVIFSLMISVKITPVFFIILIPFSLACKLFNEKRRLLDMKILIVICVLITGFFFGTVLSKSFQHPERNVGAPNVAFQDTVFWHMIWAASGYYDFDNAHGFTKSNSLRRKRVEAATGLSSAIDYVHHSQIASDVLYRPAVINAFVEDPGYYYSTAFLRFYEHALTFWRYNSSLFDLSMKWIDRKKQMISNDDMLGSTVSNEVEMIRYGYMWKISPLVLLTKIELGDMSRMTDICLILLSLLGILMMKRIDFVVFFLGVFLFKFAFSSLIHVMVRYINFCNIALLIGLSFFIVEFAKSIQNASQGLHYTKFES